MYVNVSCKASSFAHNSNMTNYPKWPNLSSDRRFCMSRICFAVFYKKLRISTLTYCRHLDIGTHPLGMALLKTARFRLNRLHIRLGRFRSCLHKWIMALSAACDLWRRRTDRWPCCPSLSNPSCIDLCIPWRFWMTTIEWLLNTCPEAQCGQAVDWKNWLIRRKRSISTYGKNKWILLWTQESSE